MAKARQTFERRQLGLALRRLRLAVKVTQQTAGDAIGLSRPRIVELEEGSGTVSTQNLAKLLDLYRVSGDQRETMLALGTRARRRRRDRKAYIDELPNGFERFADLEASASRIDTFESGFVPGFLQAPGYVQAVMDETEGILWDGGRQERIQFRQDRQSLLLDTPGRYELRVVIAEEALRATFGRPEVLREQLWHVLELMDEQPGLAVRVLRRDVQGNPLRGRNLTLFGFGDGVPVIGYSEGLMPVGIVYYDDEAVTATLELAFDRVWRLSMTEADTGRFIRAILEDL